MDRNQLALQAVKLSKDRARLCDGIPKKYAKYPVQETAGNQAALTPADGAGTSSCRSSGNLQDSKDGEHGTENITGTGGAKAKLPSPTNSSTPSSSCSSQSSIDQHGGELKKKELHG